jgi:hypothetical protein
VIPVGDSTTWRNRISGATDEELATLDQQIGPTHALRDLISDEVTSRARRRAGVGAEFQPVAVPSAAGIATTPPPAPSLDPVSVPPVPAANPAAPQASAPVAVPPFYNEGDQQTARDTVNTMDTIGRIGGEVINDYRRAAGDVLTEYGGYAQDVLTGWSDAASDAYHAWMPRLVEAGGSVLGDIGGAISQTGFPAPAGDSMLGAQITGGPTPGTSSTPQHGAMPQMSGYPPPAPDSFLGKQINPNTPTTGPGFQGALIGPQGAPIGSPAAAATVPGGPPPPSPPSPLSQVSAVPAPRRKPAIPVALPPPQTTKSAGPSSAVALNRFYADQYSQGNRPGAPATVDDARTMAGMGGLTGPYR